MHETLSVNASLLTLYIMHGNRDRGPYRTEISPLNKPIDWFLYDNFVYSQECKNSLLAHYCQ